MDTILCQRSYLGINLLLRRMFSMSGWCVRGHGCTWNPIFSSDDINRQLPVEGKRYQTMDRMWRRIMKNAKWQSTGYKWQILYNLILYNKDCFTNICVLCILIWGSDYHSYFPSAPNKHSVTEMESHQTAGQSPHRKHLLWHCLNLTCVGRLKLRYKISWTTIMTSAKLRISKYRFTQSFYWKQI